MMFGLPSWLFTQVREAEVEANRVYEVVIGVVTSISDPKKLGRVRVRFPTLAPGDDAWWATMVSPGAGRDRGWFSLPEVGDEVVCGFEHGDIGRPVVLGALWNGKDKAPDTNGGGGNERRVIVSKSGAKIVMDDQKKELRLEDGGGIGTVVISEQGMTVTAAQGDSSIVAKGELAICAGEIEIKGTTVGFFGKKVNATAGAAVKINGNVVSLKGSTIDINPGGVESAAKADGTVSEVGDGGGGGAGGGGGGGGAPGGGGGAPGGGGGAPGSGGGGPGGGGSGPAPGAGASPSSQAPGGNIPVEERPPIDLHRIEIKVVNALDLPAVGVYYELALPDGARRRGTTDGDGMILVDDIEQPGDCQLTFPDVDRQASPPASPPTA